MLSVGRMVASLLLRGSNSNAAVSTMPKPGKASGKNEKLLHGGCKMTGILPLGNRSVEFARFLIVPTGTDGCSPGNKTKTFLLAPEHSRRKARTLHVHVGGLVHEVHEELSGVDEDLVPAVSDGAVPPRALPCTKPAGAINECQKHIRRQQHTRGPLTTTTGRITMKARP